MISADDQICDDDLCIRWNHPLGCTAQGDDSQKYTFACGCRSQGPEPRPEALFVPGREPQPSVATYYLNSMNIGAALGTFPRGSMTKNSVTTAARRSIRTDVGVL